jgi:hypothetical protein
VDVVGALHRAPDGDALRRVGDGDDAVRLDVEVLLRARAVLALDDEVGLRPDLVHVPFVYQVRLEGVVVAPDDLFARERVVEREQGGQRLDFERDGAARALQEMPVLVREQDDGLLRVVDEV